MTGSGKEIQDLESCVHYFSARLPALAGTRRPYQVSSSPVVGQPFQADSNAEENVAPRGRPHVCSQTIVPRTGWPTSLKSRSNVLRSQAVSLTYFHQAAVRAQMS